MFQNIFPERQIFFRSKGEVRFVRLSPAIQTGIATCLIVICLWTLGTSYAFLAGDSRLAARQQKLSYAAHEMDALLVELERLQTQALLRAERLESRQKLLERIGGETDEGELVPVYLSPDTMEDEVADDSRAVKEDKGKEAFLHISGRDLRIAGTERPVSLASIIGVNKAMADSVPDAVKVQQRTNKVLERLSRIEQIQEKTARILIDKEREKIGSHQAVVERLGLSLDQWASLTDNASVSMGGPLVNMDAAFASGTFHTLSELANDLDSYRLILSSIPSRIPADNYYISSNFGKRKDPFRKSWATHSGVDMAGWTGEPILAAGSGRVVKSGRAPAYGLMIELDHGNGFRTRYGHMRRLSVKVGDTVDRGQKIGEMGTTGRSTGTHLHWEVRLNGELVDPLPFIKAAEDVYTLQQGGQEKG